MKGHEWNDQRSLLLHGAVAEKLRKDPAVLEKARRRVEDWLVDGSVHAHYVHAWRRLLAQGPDEVAERLVDPAETMRALRQCSPFAGALTARERWQILREALVISKLVAGREKDLEYAREAANHGLITQQGLQIRLDETPLLPEVRSLVEARIARLF